MVSAFLNRDIFVVEIRMFPRALDGDKGVAVPPHGHVRPYLSNDIEREHKLGKLLDISLL